MANVKTKLDTRRPKSDGTYNIIFKIRHQKKVYTINSGTSILEQYWDHENSEVKKEYPNAKVINLNLLKNYFKIEKAILMVEGSFSIDKLRSMVKGTPEKQTKSFKQFTDELIEQMLATNNTGNAIVYRTATNRLLNFCKKDVLFTEIDYKLLDSFKHHLQVKGLKPNSISNYFRTIRAIYNKAIKHKLVSRDNYPFYDISIKSQRTANRAISKAAIKDLMNLSLEENSASWKALNYFMLSFYLRGISFTDMAYLKQTNIVNDRIEYKRRKTHKNYSIKLFKCTKSIISKLQDSNSCYLLPIINENIVEDSLEAKKVIKQWIKTTNKYLKRLSLELQCEISITTYSSRYSFASIAKHLGYSNELIAEALGHQYGNRVTNIYLDTFDVNKLDAMHYDVIA